MTRARNLLVAAVAAVLLAGCGDTAADVFAVTRSGTVPGASFRMVVRNDGTVTCDGRRRTLPGSLLIRAQILGGDAQAPGDLQVPATQGVKLPSGPRPVFTYVVLMAAGVISFSDDSPHQPPAFYQLAQLTTQIARQVCGLPR